MKYFTYISLSLLLLFNASCKEKSRFAIDTEDIPVNISIERFDKDIYLLRTGNVAQKADSLKKIYGSFLDIYTQNILEIGTFGTPTDSLTKKPTLFHAPVDAKTEIVKMWQDSMVNVVYQDCLLEYANTTDIEKELSEAFRYFHHYFPKKQIPRVLFHFSGFHQTVVFTDSIVSASIEHYLGSDYPLYADVAYQYEVPNMTREQLPIDIVHAWIQRYYESNISNERLIDMMIYEGKVQYLLSIFFPKYSESDIIGYTKEQYEWSIRNEKNIWGHIIEQKHLFSNNWKETAGYMNPGPFTSGLSQESPSKLGVWIGFRIVQQYAENNKNVSLKELMDDTNSQRILELSNYRP